MDLNINDKTALVTGASSGIGRGIAIALGREGVRLAIAARRRDLLEETAKEITDAGGLAPIIIECDLMQEDAIDTIADTALKDLGKVNVLINNAGGSRAFNLETTDEQWEEALTLNFTRQRQLTRALIENMIDAKWGRIVNITGKSEPDGLNGRFAPKQPCIPGPRGYLVKSGNLGLQLTALLPDVLSASKS